MFTGSFDIFNCLQIKDWQKNCTNLSVRRKRHRSCCSNLAFSLDGFCVNTSPRQLVELVEIHRPWLNCRLAATIWRAPFCRDDVTLLSFENIFTLKYGFDQYSSEYSLNLLLSTDAQLSGCDDLSFRCSRVIALITLINHSIYWLSRVVHSIYGRNKAQLNQQISKIKRFYLIDVPI